MNGFMTELAKAFENKVEVVASIKAPGCSSRIVGNITDFDFDQIDLTLYFNDSYENEIRISTDKFEMMVDEEFDVDTVEYSFVSDEIKIYIDFINNEA